MRLPGLPGRNDAFGLLSAILLNSPQPYAPVKFGLVWNVDQRIWVHWDGNTMRQLLTLPNERATTFHRGSHRYDPAQMGYTDEGAYLLDTSVPGNANSGHDYGTDLSTTEKEELIEYLKTLETSDGRIDVVAGRQGSGFRRADFPPSRRAPLSFGRS